MKKLFEIRLRVERQNIWDDSLEMWTNKDSSKFTINFLDNGNFLVSKASGRKFIETFLEETVIDVKEKIEQSINKSFDMSDLLIVDKKINEFQFDHIIKSKEELKKEIFDFEDTDFEEHVNWVKNIKLFVEIVMFDTDNVNDNKRIIKEIFDI